MTDEKRNRIIAAVTVNVILLIAILAAVVVYQIVQITVIKRNRDKIKADINWFIEHAVDENTSLEYWQSDAGLEDLAYKFGFVYGK